MTMASTSLLGLLSTSTTPTSPTMAPKLLGNGNFLDLSQSPGVNHNLSETSSKSNLMTYAIQDFNVSMAKFNSHLYSDITMTTAPTRKTKKGGSRGRRRGPASSDFIEKMEKIVLPTAYTIGIVGSLFLIPVFTCTPLKASALSHYLTAIGVSDFMYLFASLIVWITRQGYRINNVLGICQLNSFTLRLSTFMGTWYLFMAHVERCLIHFGSPKARVWCSAFRSKCIILVIFIFSMVGFLHYTWTHVIDEDYKGRKCKLMRESVKHILELNKIEAVVSNFLPMTLMIIMDILLICSMILKRCNAAKSRGGIKSHNNNSSRNNSTRSNGNGGSSTGDRMDGYVLAQRQRTRSPSNCVGYSDSDPPPPEFDLSREKSCATLVVVILGVLFVGFSFPSAIYRTKFAFNPTPMTRPSPEEQFIMIFSNHLDIFDHIFKCFFYIFMLRGFRHGILHLRQCRRKRTVCSNSLQETEV